jgi:hypothetical protein
MTQRQTVTLLAVVLGAATSFAPASARLLAGQATLPTGRDLVARHVAAIGGARALAAIKSMRVRGRLEIPAQKIAGDLEVLTARPAKMLYRVTVPGIGRIENGYDGKIGWSVSPVAGPELLTGRQLTEAADDAWFDGALHAPDHVRELTTLERTEFDRRAAFKVKVVFVSGNEATEYFDVQTGLQIGAEAARATPQGVLQTVNIVRDFRKFGPLVQATVFIQRALGFEQVVTVASCEYDVVPDNAFDPPAAVAALIPR